MAKVSLDLNQFKANGVYTVEFDASESFTISSQQLRLIVGFSRKGPFNAPVFLQDIKSAKRIFGEIDTYLEKKGSFFHRAIATALQTGPVFAINLMPLNNTPTGDKIDYRSFSLSTNEDNGIVSEDLLASFYNKERFWFAESSYFEAIVNNNAVNENKLISFTNLSQEPMSILVRKAKNINGFDITARDFYGIGNIPNFVRDFDFISDYFIDVIAVQGDWTDYANLSIDPEYSTYFDSRGIKVDMIESFIASDNITSIASFTGCIIPDFTDRQGSNQYIETIINNSTGITGLFVSLNRTALDDYENSQYKVDLIGHSLINSTKSDINMLSYVSPISDEIGYTSYQTIEQENMPLEYKSTDFSSIGDIYPYIKSIPYVNDDRGLFLNTIVIPKPRAEFSGQVFTLNTYNNLLRDLTKDSLLKTYESVNNAWKYVKVESITNTGTSIEITYSNPGDDTHVNKEILGITSDMIVTNVDTVANAITVTNIDATDLEKFDLVYFKSLNKYLVVESINTSTPSHEIKFFASKADVIADAGYSTVSWLNYEKSLDEITIVSSDMLNKTAIGCSIDIAKTLVVKISNELSISTIEYIAAPSYMYIDSIDDNIVVLPGNKLVADVLNNSTVNGDTVSISPEYNIFNYLSFEEFTTIYGLTGIKVKQWQSENLTAIATNKIDFTGNYSYTKDGIPTDISYWDGGRGLVIYSTHGQIEESVEIINGSLNASKTLFKISAINAAKIEVGQYLVTADINDPKLTIVISKVKQVNTSTNEVEYMITVNEPIRVQEISGSFFVSRFLDINDKKFTTNLQFTSLGGFTITNYHVPGTPSQLAKILGVIESTNLGDTLADKEIIQFRYIVDTFNGGLAPIMGPKSILSRLAKQRQKCMAILNAPSIGEFITSNDPRFTDIPDPSAGNPKPVLQTKYIADGGNLTLGPSYRFTLPDDANGARYCGVFTPFIKIRENNKNKMVPPAADISNNFIRKFKNGTPYAIAAGPRRGIISNTLMSGLEYDFIQADREYLEPMGLNCIVNSRKYGPMIYGNATAYQKTVSAFNNLHVRDLLITIEESIDNILSNYVFEYNDAATRLEIKTIVDGYLQNVRNSGGIYEFLTIMDESNNTNDVIDQNIGIIDIGIEPARGLQKIISRITVLKSGGIASGGFTVS